LLLWRGRSTVLVAAILAVLEPTMGWSAILLVVLLITVLVAAILLLWLLLVVAVLRWGRTLLIATISLLRGLVAILALVLVVVSVRVRHDAYGIRCDVVWSLRCEEK
jgi:hypothetical protein